MKRRRCHPALVVGGVSIAALGLVSVAAFTPSLVWNASASAALGLYLIENRAPKQGDFVLVKPDDSLESLIAERGYLPKNIPLLKRVAALPGAEICRKGEGVFIDELQVAEALLFDSQGRKLPVWEGCFSLSARQIFLLNDPKNSLDGRYFGATERDDVIGVAVPVFVTGNAR